MSPRASGELRSGFSLSGRRATTKNADGSWTGGGDYVVLKGIAHGYASGAGVDAVVNALTNGSRENRHAPKKRLCDKGTRR
jgi:hypothetical protein